MVLFNSTSYQNQYCVKSLELRSYFWSVFSCIRTEYEHPRRNAISIKLQSNFFEISLRHGCSASEVWFEAIKNSTQHPAKIINWLYPINGLYCLIPKKSIFTIELILNNFFYILPRIPKKQSKVWLPMNSNVCRNVTDFKVSSLEKMH